MNIIETQKGFTLIEFIVIISIFAIVASISFFSFSGFSSNISLSNLTHDIALVIREAQVGAISNLSGNNDPEDPIRRGVYFTYDNTLTPERFTDDMVIFDDYISGGDTFFDDPQEEVDTVIVQSSDYISAIDTGTTSSNAIGCTEPTGVRILFQRPNPNPSIYCGNGIAETFARIHISSSDGLQTRSIEIYPTGQISVE